MLCYIFVEMSAATVNLVILRFCVLRLYLFAPVYTQVTTCCSNRKTLRASITLNRSPLGLVRRRRSRTTLRRSRLLRNCSPKYTTGYVYYVTLLSVLLSHCGFFAGLHSTCTVDRCAHRASCVQMSYEY